MGESMIELAVESLRSQLNRLTKEVKELRAELVKVRNRKEPIKEDKNSEEKLDELLTTKKVQKILGVCYNTLQKNIVKKGLLVPKRLSARKIRYSKRELIAYIEKLNNHQLKGESHE